ncbi:DUF3768 domain-containing protein [Methylocystis sp.]|uniref:DUF3768 domain-containing protein n=1 Tax=Methylocystis sp. TaxID=1911079 RepID=UPI0025EEC9B8|nr:DUF3768 domain-containing protein [Methylocystis sp.]
MSHIDSATRDRIRELNDAFRKGERPDLGRVVITPGVRELVAAWPLGELGVYEAVQRFGDFTEDNDPNGEHDFGAFDHAGKRCFWKLDYYDLTLEYGSEDPSDPSLTTRLLTIMLVEEY